MPWLVLILELEKLTFSKALAIGQFEPPNQFARRKQRCICNQNARWDRGWKMDSSRETSITYIIQHMTAAVGS